MNCRDTWENQIFALTKIQIGMRHLHLLVTLSLACAGLLVGCADPAPAQPETVIIPETVAAPPPAPPVAKDHAAFKEEMLTFLHNMQALPDHGVMDEIPTQKLFAYFSGHIPSMHPFPVLYLDKAGGRFHISHKAMVDSISATLPDSAINAYIEQLRAHGYVVRGKGGDDADALSLEGLFPDESKTAKFFKPAQLEFLHGNVSASAAFAYLAGVGEWGRGVPMMAGVGYEQKARLWVLGPDVAEEYTFDEADAAFASWKALVAAH